jgi:hypothetical protein
LLSTSTGGAWWSFSADFLVETSRPSDSRSSLVPETDPEIPRFLPQRTFRSLHKHVGSGSTAEGELEWRVVPGETADSLIQVNLFWRLSGPLAQFNRGGLVEDVIQRLASIFVTNLEASLKGEAISERSVKPLGVRSLM